VGARLVEATDLGASVVTLFDPPAPDPRPRYVLVKLTTADWRSTDPATYVRASMPGFMGTIEATEVDAPDTNHLGRFQAHSSTSRAAALAVFPRTGTQRARVLNYIRSARDGRTDEEIATGLAMNPSSVRPRRIELVTGGWVRAMTTAAGYVVERPTRSGADAQVWEATNAARSYLP
jgi:hypothetical protein